MGTNLTIPEWVGSTLTNGDFLNYASRSLAAYVAPGLGNINLTQIGMSLTEAIDDLRTAVNRQAAFDETVDVTRADNDRDSLARALYHAWEFLGGLSPTHPFAEHVQTLRSEMNAYKGVWAHKIPKETEELVGFRGALAKDANKAALAALGLDKIAAALWTANEECVAALKSRTTERADRDEKKALGTTPELRKAVAELLIKAAKRVNAVYELDPSNESAAKAISTVAAIVEEFKLVAAEAKHRKGGDDPEPGPETK